MHSLTDLEEKIAAGARFTAEDAARVLASPDLISVGVVGDAARKRLAGETITFGRVCEVAGERPATVGDPGEVRLTGSPASIDDAVARVRAAAAWTGGAAMTGFSLVDLLRWAETGVPIEDAARRLRIAGLEALAEVPVDAAADADALIEAVRAVHRGGLATWRATVTSAPAPARLDLLARAAALQEATGALRAFAPLPRVDPRDTPSTGYDDVRTVAAARLLCGAVPAIQVDWPLYGPKLAQVALTYGASDVDGVSAVDDESLGARRSPREDIERQIRAAGGVPVARNGRYERLA
jgi:aminodeoxyfutalosine synthase